VTVAAVIFSASAEEAAAPVDGVARVRRVVDAAWSGGAMPVVVVAPDPGGTLAGALAGSTADVVLPTPTDADPGPAAVLRPTWEGQPGWPVLVPLAVLDSLRAMSPGLSPDRLLGVLEQAGVAVRLLDLGDPGATHDVATPRVALPAYAGPDQPVTGHPPDWGSDVAQALPDR
jgi:CTP:molybdopterin cytidylyltransferase MocA